MPKPEVTEVVTITQPMITINLMVKLWPDRSHGIEVGMSYTRDLIGRETLKTASAKMRNELLKELKVSVNRTAKELGISTMPIV